MSIDQPQLLFLNFFLQKLCSFLSIGWGLMADIDIESERLRMIGEARFTVWALARVMRMLYNIIKRNYEKPTILLNSLIPCIGLRTYKATLSYLPAESDTVLDQIVPLPPLEEPLPDDQRWIHQNGEFVCIYSSTVPFIGTIKQ